LRDGTSGGGALTSSVTRQTIFKPAGHPPAGLLLRGAIDRKTKKLNFAPESS
jgi:hypothetical protein